MEQKCKDKETHEFIGNKCLVKCKDGKTRNANNRCVNVPREKRTNATTTTQKQTKEKKQKCNERTHEFIGNKCLVKCKDGKTRNANNRCVKKSNPPPPTNQLILPPHNKMATEKETTDYIKFVKDMTQLGEKYIDTGIEYPNMNALIDGFMLSYLMNNYKNASKCLVLNKNNLVFYFYSTTFTMKKSYNDFVKQLLNCLKQNKNNDNNILLIPIGLVMVVNGNNYGHLNFLIYRNSTSTFEHFEPHGTIHSEQNGYIKFSKDLYKFFNKMVKNLNIYNNEHNKQFFNKNIRYIEPKKLCPSLVGFQSMEANSVNKYSLNHPESGFCRMWGFFFAELVLMNPTIKSEQLITNILKWMRTEHNFKHVISIIRGYTHMMYERIENMLKKHDPTMTIQKFHVEQDKETQILILNNLFKEVDNEYYDYIVNHQNYKIDSLNMV